MAEPGWPRHMLSVGVFEFRRTVRVIWQDKARVVLMTLGVLLPSLMTTAFVVAFAETIRSFETLPAPRQLRGGVALFWLFAVFLIGQRVVSARTRIEAEPLMLTTVSVRSVAGGLAIAELLRLLAYLGLPVLVVTGAGVYLFGSPATVLFVPLAAVLFAATVVVTGAAAGYAVAWLVATSRFIARHKMILGTATSLLGMGLYFLFFFPQIAGFSQASLAWLPVGWFIDLAVVGTGLMDASIQTIGAVVGSTVLLVAGGAVIERVAVALWFTEAVSVESSSLSQATATTEETAPTPATRRDALAAAVSPLVVPDVISTPVRRVAEWALLRTRRDPNRLMFLMIPVFAIGSPLVSSAVQSGSIGTVAAPLSVVGLSWLVGAVFALNPLGDEGAVLPVTLTSVSGRQYVRGLMVPGFVFGLPLVLVVTLVAGLASPYPLGAQLALLGLAAYLTAVSTTITPAIGMALPRFSAISVGQSKDVVPPRMSAVAVHAVLTVVPGAFLTALILAPGLARAAIAGLVGYLPGILLGLLGNADGGALATAATSFRDIGDGIQALELAQFQGIAGGAVLLGGLFVSVLLYRNAIHRFDQYHPA